MPGRLPPLSFMLRRSFFAWATPIYLGSIAAGTAALVAVAVWYAAWHGWHAAGLGFVARLLQVLPRARPEAVPVRLRLAVLRDDLVPLEHEIITDLRPGPSPSFARASPPT